MISITNEMFLCDVSYEQLPGTIIVREPNPIFLNSVAPERVKAMDPSNI